jgi:WD40 repeat protein
MNLDIIVGVIFTGAALVWKRDGDYYNLFGLFSGHKNEVTDISWSENGEFLISCSLDSTSRIFT